MNKSGSCGGFRWCLHDFSVRPNFLIDVSATVESVSETPATVHLVRLVTVLEGQWVRGTPRTARVTVQPP